jgi:tetratricopeptide (TPR) repeat protein
MRAVLVFLLWPVLLIADVAKEQPLGLILTPGDGKLVRAGSELPLSARTGDILFAGDALRSASEPVTFLYCPEQATENLSPKADVLIEPKQLRVRAGKITGKNPTGSCFLPQTVRLSVASQQHYGVSMVRALNPAGGKPGTLESRLKALPEGDRARIQAELQALAGHSDPAAGLARAGIFEKYHLREDALAEYRKLAELWPDAVWLRARIFELDEALAAAQAEATREEGGRIFALLVGVSHYQRLPENLWLQYAHADATLFARHLRSPRGGGLPDSDVVLLANEKATTAAIRNAFETFLKGRAGKKDTVLLFLAAHGTVEPGRGAFILTYDSDPQDLVSTALPMADVQKLIQEDLSKVGRVLAFVDVCRAGTIGAIKSSTVNSVVERLAEAEGEIFGLMASRPKEFSLEGQEFGGGHGAFSYYLLKGLQGDADKNKDGVVNVNELIEYVRAKVAEGTRDRQHPRDFGNVENSLALSDGRKPGIDLAFFPGLFRLAFQGPAQGLGGADSAVRTFHEAIAAGRLLPEERGSAFGLLAGLKPRLDSKVYLQQENDLRVALEDRGQQVLLRYLSGDQVPQTRRDFEAGANYFMAARRLTPESIFLEGREDFCRGRASLFTKDYRGAANLLEQAARLDGGGAYSYNGLGIAYLEQADYSRAILAFRDAVRRAPYWAYPLHNLALAYAESGDYTNAIRSYQQAIKLAPQYSYLPYNLGLLYQRMNRRKDAETAYQRAIALAPNQADPYNALGSLKAESGKGSEAEKLYREALARSPELPAARHNLALLLSSRTDRRDEAIRLWQQNIEKSPEFVPSRVSLAEALARDGKIPDAADQYREVLRLKPDYVAARLALAGLLEKQQQYAPAVEQIAEALKQQPRNAQLHERMGDLEQAQNHAAAASQAWQEALRYTDDAAARRRVRRKLATQSHQQ